mmetsp:Transcript_8714/g.15814  ORF Transcript_8714/g.15814 Transcript_8714/m.15814 type:complete len:754 (-) Transcript_8714:42-2303(-)
MNTFLFAISLFSTVILNLKVYPIHALIHPLAPPPGKLILVRHGQSIWNANKTFTGWEDPDLSQQGTREAIHAGRLLLSKGYLIDVVYTSRLKRSIRSAWEIMTELSSVHLPVYKSWRLNERHYGAFQGQSKVDMAIKLGADEVQKFRGGLFERPPPITETHESNDRKHADLTERQMPRTESLYDCMGRTKPLWEDRIKEDLRKGRNVLVVAHGNSLRGLVKMIDSIPDDAIKDVAIPTGIPIVYKFNKRMQPVEDENEEGNQKLNMTGVFEGIVAHKIRGQFMEKPGLLREALKREQLWQQKVPGFDDANNNNPPLTLSGERSQQQQLTQMEQSLFKLQDEKSLMEEPSSSSPPSPSPIEQAREAAVSGNILSPLFPSSPSPSPQNDTSPISPSNPNYYSGTKRLENYQDKCAKNVVTFSNSVKVPIRKDSVVVIIRHGKTSHNQLGLFTGWEDAPLAEEGRDEAREAGKLLKLHGFEFDVVYTSWLSRAIETAWLALDELDSLWLPIIKTWRLNERMYGRLTGLDKKMVAQRHGQDQFMKWRRGFRDRPPRVSSFSPLYPGNDERYSKDGGLKDVRYSFSESMIRTWESGRLKLHRKLPKTESLSDCMKRTIPFLVDRVIPDSINKGQRVLISSSENAIRGLLMHLCDIPEDRISDLEIPNGLPLIYDVNSRCIKLLDDGTGRDLTEVYNFGSAVEFLFRPCIGEDGEEEEECNLAIDWPEIRIPIPESNYANGNDSLSNLSEEEKNELTIL